MFFASSLLLPVRELISRNIDGFVKSCKFYPKEKIHFSGKKFRLTFQENRDLHREYINISNIIIKVKIMLLKNSPKLEHKIQKRQSCFNPKAGGTAGETRQTGDCFWQRQALCRFALRETGYGLLLRRQWKLPVKVLI
jgi:hypothetical protein